MHFNVTGFVFNRMKANTHTHYYIYNWFLWGWWNLLNFLIDLFDSLSRVARPVWAPWLHLVLLGNELSTHLLSAFRPAADTPVLFDTDLSTTKRISLAAFQTDLSPPQVEYKVTLFYCVIKLNIFYMSTQLTIVNLCKKAAAWVTVLTVDQYSTCM